MSRALPFTTANLDEALQAVADRSFYEPTLITPLSAAPHDPRNEVVAWLVDEGTNILPADEVTWTYANGIADGPETEKSRLFEAYETFATAEHVRYNMGESVEHLESGTSAVVFAYAVVNVDVDDPAHESGDTADNVAGWALLALALDEKVTR